MDRSDGSSERIAVRQTTPGEPADDQETGPAHVELLTPSSRALVLLAVGAGLIATETALLVDRGTTWTATTPLLAVVVAVPYLIVPRLAARSAAPETLVGALLLFTVGIWADVSAPNTALAWFLVALYLSGIELAIFTLGRLLRAHLHNRRQRAR